VWSITKEVNHKTKQYKKNRDENGVQTNVLVGKQEEQKSKVSGDKKKKAREDALLPTMQHDGIYLKHGKEIYYQEATRKKSSIEIIQRTIQEVLLQ
jgi:hypothetical protein